MEENRKGRFFGVILKKLKCLRNENITERDRERESGLEREVISQGASV